MKKTFTIVCFLLLFAATLRGESIKPTHFGIYAGAGWLHYFNNMELDTKEQSTMTKDFPCFSGRFIWEPDHLISVGLESGYYTMYSFEDTTGRSITAGFVPILLSVHMRIIDNFSLGIGTGAVFLNEKITGQSPTKSTTASLSNFHFLANYKYPINTNFVVGAEARYMWIGKANDFNFALQALVGYRF